METNLIEKKTINTILEYLKKYPDHYSSRKKDKINMSSPKDIILIKEKIIEGLRKKIKIELPKTIPDPMVSEFIKEFYDHNKKDVKKIKLGHSQSMAVENYLGIFLEAYIAKEGYEFGWIQCVGDIIKATDFIKKNGNKWIRLQVKMRSNTENSSSSKIREGTSIIKWHRINAYTGENYWGFFPDKNLKKILTENKFKKFVINYLKELKK